MKKFISVFMTLIMAMTLFVSCGENSSKDYDFYIFNTKGENADAMQKAVDAYSEKTGQKIKVFSLGAGTNAADTLRAEMNSKNMPAIFSIMNIRELEEWSEGGFALDLSTVENADFKAMHDEIPDSLRLTSDGKSYGIPYNVEGYGYIVDTKMLADLFGEENVDEFLEDFREATYSEFEALVEKVNSYIKEGTAGEVLLDGEEYTLKPEKTELSKKLTGVFAVAGSEKWTYGDHMINIALDAVFANPDEAKNADAKKIEDLKNPLMAYARALDLKSSYVAGDEGALKRGPQMINSTTNGYDAAVQRFAEHKALFIKQGNWAYSNIEKANPEIVSTLTFLPIKMPFEDKDITVDSLDAEKINRSIAVFVPNYYAINAKVSKEEQQKAVDFLVWLNTTTEGEKFVTEDMAFIPHNAEPSVTKLDNSLSDSIIEYMHEGDTITNSYAGAPINWTGETVGLEIMEKYLTKEDWDEKDYEQIADYAILRYKEMAGI